MRYQQLIQFLAVARTGKFRKASRELGISQPALTRSIQNLEEQFNVPLFDRLPGGVSMTDYGNMIFLWAQEVVNNTENVKRQIDLLRSVSTGKLVVGTGSYFADSILPTTVARFITKHPDLRIKIIRDKIENLQKLLINREVDIFLGWVLKLPETEDIIFKTLLSEEIILFCRKEHPLLDRGELNLRDFFRYPFAAPMVSEQTQKVIDQHRFNYVHGQEIAVGVEFDSYSAIRNIVEMTDCVGGLPESSILPYCQEGPFQRLPSVFPELRGRAVACHVKDRTLLPAAQLLIDELTRTVLRRFHEVREHEGQGTA